MKVQVLVTCMCSGQISPNSCHFWNKRSVFLQILHQSSGSWDITPLYFLAKILYSLRSLSKYKFGEISCEQSKVKKVQKRYLSWHWTVIQSLRKNSLFVWKMTWEIWWVLTWAVKNLKIYISFTEFKYQSFRLYCISILVTLTSFLTCM